MRRINENLSCYATYDITVDKLTPEANQGLSHFYGHMPRLRTVVEIF